MKFNIHVVAYGILILIVLILLNIVLIQPGEVPSTDTTTGEWTVYGTQGCGWTRKQLEVMESKKIPHKFIDCDKEDCGSVSAFPTLLDPNGATTVGFKDSF
jgi:hypothetical protein